MGAALASPGSKSRTAKNYQIDGFQTSQLQTSKSTIGFRDKSSYSHTSLFRSGFISSLSLKKLNISSNKRRNQSGTPGPNDHSKTGSSNGCNQTIATVSGVTNEPSYEDICVNHRLGGHLQMPQPPAPIHHHSRISTNNLTKSLSCYTLKFNARMDPEQRKTVIHASTSELLKCLGIFVCLQCPLLDHLQPESIINWVRSLDRSLILQGWSEIAFINPANVVFLYMLLKDTLDPSTTSERDLQCAVLTCLYLSYSYMGNEISYPLKPFLFEENREVFWSRCMMIVNRCSAAMLRLNASSVNFTATFTELKSYYLQ